METTQKTTFNFLRGGGRMADLIRACNWSQTAVGHPAQWPQSLRTTLGIVLASKTPTLLYWGEELTVFYNDALQQSMGGDGKLPSALGQPAHTVWAEAWAVLKPSVEQVMAGGEATLMEDQLVRIHGNNQWEDRYWTYDFTPVYTEPETTEGVLVLCTETTAAMHNLQRLRLSDQRFQNLVQEATAGIIVLTGPEMRVDVVNEAYGRLIALRPDDLLGKPLFDLIPDAEAFFRPLLDKVRLTGEPLYLSDQLYSVVINGKQIEGYLNVVYQPYKDTDGSTTGVMVICQDVTEQVLSRQKIESSEALFRSLITAAPLGIGIFRGRELIIENPNQTFIDIVGKGDGITGKPLAEAMPELITEGQPFLRILDDVYTTGKIFQTAGTQVNIVQNGVMNHGFYDFSYTPLFDADGKVYAILDIAVEVTERVLSARALAESEKNLRNTILQAPVAMGIFRGPEHIIEIANERMFDLWGKGMEEMTGKPMFEALPEAKDQGFETFLNTVYTKGETAEAHGVPVTLPRNGGIEMVYVDFVMKAFREADGHISGVIAVAIEVTEQVLARKKIESSEARFRLMADAMPQFVWTADVQGNLNYYNEAVYNYSGLNYEQIKKDGWLQIVHPDDQEENVAQWIHAVKTGTAFIFQHRFKNVAGDYRWQLSRAVPQRDSDGTIQLWIGTSTDIHEQKMFEEELEQLVSERTRELQRSNEDLQQFAHVASHDLKEPVRKIRLFGSRLKGEFGENLPDMAKQFIEKIESAAARMYAMIDGVLLYSSASAQTQTGESVDLNETLQTIETDLEVLIQQKGALVTYENLPAVEGSSVLLYQLFYNLVLNSLKFSKPETTPVIHITTAVFFPIEQGRAREAKDFVRIYVRDNGIGFNQDQAQTIFKTFTRLHAKDQYEGTGLGLALCQKIAERHGGSIVAEGTEGEGAMFIVTLPLRQS